MLEIGWLFRPEWEVVLASCSTSVKRNSLQAIGVAFNWMNQAAKMTAQSMVFSMFLRQIKPHLKRKKTKIHGKKPFFHFRYFNCPPNYGIFVPLAKVSLSPLSRKSRLSRAGSKESLNSIGTMGSITSTNTSRLRMSAQVPLTTTTYHVVYSTY